MSRVDFKGIFRLLEEVDAGGRSSLYEHECYDLLTATGGRASSAAWGFIVGNLGIGLAAAAGVADVDVAHPAAGGLVDPAAVGVFGRKAPMDHVLRDGDRVEIYRPLIADPKEARRLRAQTDKKQGN